MSNLQLKTKNFVSRVWPILFIIGVWFVFAHPYFLQGKVPFASTYQVNHFAPWSAYEQFWGPVKNGAMPDVITQIYPWRHLAVEIWKSGQIPLWNPYSFSGNPLLANYQSATLSPFNLLFFIFPFVEGWSILVLFQPLLAGIFMYLFVRAIGVSKLGSLISSIAFMFCGFITVWMGYATLGYAILFLPLSLFYIEKYFQTQKRIFLLLLSFMFPLSFFSGHFQISLYFLIAVLAYIVYKFVATKNIRNTFLPREALAKWGYLILFYTLFGLLMTMPQILPSMELYFESFRSSFFQTGFIPLQYLPTFLAPDFFGNPVTRNTWFGHYAEWNAFIGVLPLMLAIYSILRKKNHQVFFLFFFGIFTLILATNNFFSNFILDLNIPVFSNSSINRMIVLYSFSFVVLAGLGFDQLLLDIKNRKKGAIVFWTGFFAIIFIALWVGVGFKIFVPSDKTIVARQNLILPTLLFLGSTIAIIWGLLTRKHKYSKLFLSSVGVFLVLITSFDMLRFAIKWNPFDPKDLVFPDTETTKAFSKISGFNRVLGNFGGEAAVYYKLPSVEGYDALYSKRYGQLIGFIEKENIIDSSWSVVNFPKKGTHTAKAIKLLDVKYIVHKLLDNKAPWTFPFWTYPENQFDLIYKDKKYELYKNNSVFPHAFLVSKYHIIKNDKEILQTLFSEDFDLRNEIILEEDPKIKKSGTDIGAVKIISYTPNKINLAVDAKSEGLLFIPDNYNKGWKAEIDGSQVSIYRANYTFKTVVIAQGKHNIELKYEPLSFRLGVFLALLGTIGAFSFFFAPKISTR